MYKRSTRDNPNTGPGPSARATSVRAWWMTSVMMMSVLLGGCAAYRSFSNGQSDIEQGHLAQGVGELHDAVNRDPHNADYRREYFTQRDSAMNALEAQATQALDAGDFAKARDVYAQMLQLDPDDARAQSGQNKVETAQRHQKMLQQARALAEKGDLDDAIETTKQVLSENPNHRQADVLLKHFMRQRAERSDKTLGIYPQLKAAYRTPVSLSFTNASLRQVFEALKSASGLNYVFDKDVQADARVTLSVTKKPVADVLRLMLATNQLDSQVLDGDTLLIYPNTPSKVAEYKDMVVRSFYLSNADVTKTANLIKTITKAKDVVVDERLNMIVIRDSPEVVRLAEKLIAAEDMPEAEVVLDLEVMEVSTNRLLQAGVTWPSSISASVVGSSGVPGKLTLDEFRKRNSGLVQLQLNDPLVSAILSNQTGDSNLLANPRIRVRNRQTAKILVGEKVPVITTTNTANVGSSQSVSYLDVGLKLNIEPTVSLDDEVSMKLDLEVSNILDTITTPTLTTYRLGTRNTSTSLRVADGETTVLAGLIQKEQQNSNTGVPGLNELPLLSHLFGNGQNSDNRTEIILLITPHIVRNVEVPGVGLQEFLSGTQDAVGAAPIQLGDPEMVDTDKRPRPTQPVPLLAPPQPPGAAAASTVDSPRANSAPTTSVANAPANPAGGSSNISSSNQPPSAAPAAGSGNLPRPKWLPANIPWPMRPPTPPAPSSKVSP